MATFRPLGFCPHCQYPVDPGQCPECGRLVPRPLRRPRRIWRKRLIVAAGLVALAAAGTAGYRNRDELAVRFAPTRLVRKYAGRGEFGAWCERILAEQYRRAEAAERDPSEARASDIRRECAALGAHDWAGTYVSGGRALSLAPQAGFAYSTWTCMTSTFSHGDVVEVTSDRIAIRSVPALRGFDIEPRQWLRAEWQGCQYLIPESEVVDFANNVNSRDPGAPYWHLRREQDKVRPEPRLPHLPQPYTHYIRKDPLLAQVTQVHETGRLPNDPSGTCWQSRVTLNVGSAEGVFVGMKFYATHRDTFLGAGIVDAEAHQSIATFTDCFKRDESFDMTVVGWRFTTLSPMARYGGEFIKLRNDGNDPMFDDELPESSESSASPESPSSPASP